MGLGITDVERALRALAPQERAEVIRLGLRSLDGGHDQGEPGAAEGEWLDELSRRVDDVDEGRIELGTFAATRAEFERRHPRGDE